MGWVNLECVSESQMGWNRASLISTLFTNTDSKNKSEKKRAIKCVSGMHAQLENHIHDITSTITFIS